MNEAADDVLIIKGVEYVPVGRAHAATVERMAELENESVRLRDDSNMRQSVIEIFGAAIAKLLPGFRASGTPVEHARKVAAELAAKVEPLRREYDSACDQIAAAHDALPDEPGLRGPLMPVAIRRLVEQRDGAIAAHEQEHARRCELRTDYGVIERDRNRMRPVVEAFGEYADLWRSMAEGDEVVPPEWVAALKALDAMRAAKPPEPFVERDGRWFCARCGQGMGRLHHMFPLACPTCAEAEPPEPAPAPAYRVTAAGALAADSLVLGPPLDQLVGIARRKLGAEQLAGFDALLNDTTVLTVQAQLDRDEQIYGIAIARRLADGSRQRVDPRSVVLQSIPPESTPAPVPECQCTSEQGDSDCPVHPTCHSCGAHLTDEDGTPRIAGLATAPALAAVVTGDVEALGDEPSDNDYFLAKAAEQRVKLATTSTPAIAVSGDVDRLRSLAAACRDEGLIRVTIAGSQMVALACAIFLDRDEVLGWLRRLVVWEEGVLVSTGGIGPGTARNNRAWELIQAMPTSVRAMLEGGDNG